MNMEAPLYNTKRESLTIGLWFLIVSLTVIGPVSSIGGLLSDLSELKRVAPSATQIPALKMYLSWAWAIVLIEAALGITIAVMLYKARVRKTLTTASILLWIRFVIVCVLFFFAHSSSGVEADAGTAADITKRIMWVILWTFYLLLSKKVQAIYQ